MNTLVKILAISAVLLTLSACKPGVYHPFGDTNASTNTNSNAQAGTNAKPAEPMGIGGRVVLPPPQS